jgi:hypothetical protein
MTIKFLLLVNKQGQTRLAKYFTELLSTDEKRALEGEIVRKCLARTDRQVGGCCRQARAPPCMQGVAGGVPCEQCLCHDIVVVPTLCARACSARYLSTAATR